MDNDIQALTALVKEFVDERDWDQFHNPKDLALALSIEAAELNEVFLWKSPEEADREKIAEELADVFTYAFMMAEKCGLDVAEIKHNGEIYDFEQEERRKARIAYQHIQRTKKEKERDLLREVKSL